MITTSMLTQAQDRISKYIHRTPLTFDQHNQFYLKWENRQITGSFKLRGALNKVLSVDKTDQNRELVTASAGNHGQGVALAARHTGDRVKVFVSEHAVPAKVAAMQSLGAEVHSVRGGYAEAEKAAQAYARDRGAVWVSPYNDLEVIAGQGTIGLEIQEQLAVQVEACLVPAGGGGLICGVGAAFHSLSNSIPIIGVQSEASAYMYALFHNCTQTDVLERESLADGLSGAVEENSLTIELSRKLVMDIILVSEEEIEKAIAYAWYTYQETIEGSAAVGLAAALSGKIKQRPILIIVSGGNIQPERHAEILNRWGPTIPEGKR
ncbi:MAG: pyridoxal-phosphate dependent enzyme [Anaerolineaceae bacterium]|nr:pyridoxal-phosphate dependent enzyme [Anaerolineaceae bacterium]